MNIKTLLQAKILKKIAIVLILLIGVVLILDIPNIQIDRYNFEQLEKAKPILESIPLDAKKFYTLKEFNEIYKADIRPIDNCYLIGNSNGNQKYTDSCIQIIFMHIQNMMSKKLLSVIIFHAMMRILHTFGM